MEINFDWPAIRAHFRASWKSNFHVSIASVNAEHHPTVTPIGSLFLNQDATGFYFEKYPTSLPLHVQVNPNICILAVNSGRWFWLTSLFRGRFPTYPAVKLYGLMGQKRLATGDEKKRLLNRMKSASRLKGYHYLWKDMEYVRELKFIRAEKINLGSMTSHL
ncbi:MAG: hypothetical protein SH818_00230 [Saprospiraceae bacterium]|nr:hypothetical protein [Saprospiraceae bacterium]